MVTVTCIAFTADWGAGGKVCLSTVEVSVKIKRQWGTNACGYWIGGTWGWLKESGKEIVLCVHVSVCMCVCVCVSVCERIG